MASHIKGAGLSSLDTRDTGPQRNFFGILDLVKPTPVPDAQRHLPGLGGGVLDLVGCTDDEIQSAFPERPTKRTFESGAAEAPHGS